MHFLFIILIFFIDKYLNCHVHHIVYWSINIVVNEIYIRAIFSNYIFSSGCIWYRGEWPRSFYWKYGNDYCIKSSTSSRLRISIIKNSLLILLGLLRCVEVMKYIQIEKCHQLIVYGLLCESILRIFFKIQFMVGSFSTTRACPALRTVYIVSCLYFM